MNEAQDYEVLEAFYTAVFRECMEEHHPISVTALVYDCLRRAYYNAVVPEEIIDPAGKIRVWVGKKLHETPIFPVHELELEWHGIHGRIDEYDPERRLLMDKKTTRHIPKEPYEHHVKQLLFYKVLMEHSGYPVEKAVVLYIDVNSTDVAAYPVDLQNYDMKAVEEEMLEKAEKLRRALKSGILPPRKMSWLCGYCVYFGWCFLNYMPLVPEKVLRKIEGDGDADDRGLEEKIREEDAEGRAVAAGGR